MKGFFLLYVGVTLMSLMSPIIAAAQIPSSAVDQKLINWMKSNISPQTHLPLSFYISPEDKNKIYQSMGDGDSVPGVIERMIVDEGLDIYDGAVGQIALMLSGTEEDMRLAMVPVQTYWQGYIGELQNIRSGYPSQAFVYNPQHPFNVSSDLTLIGKRGFIFRIINAHGRYNGVDPLDGKTQMANFPKWPMIHWEDWKPIAGENAWVVIGALQLYHKKYFNFVTGRYQAPLRSIELSLAKELARAAIQLQSDVGGIRMAPIGTYSANESDDNHLWWYEEISTENNLSWYAAFKILYQITEDSMYKEAMEKVESYFHQVWNPVGQYFYQGMHGTNGQWKVNTAHFAVDVQTWGIMALGAAKIDEWFGEGSAYQMWVAAKNASGFWMNGELLGVGYTMEHDRMSVEWTAGAIMAAREVAQYYSLMNVPWARQAFQDAQSMRGGIEILRKDLSPTQAAYAYSSKRGWIPFGWYSHDPSVMSLASTGWVIFVDTNFNPFNIPENNF